MTRKLEKWIAGVLAMATTLVSVASFAYSTFESKEHAREVKKDIMELAYQRHIEILDRLKAIDLKLGGRPYPSR